MQNTFSDGTRRLILALMLGAMLVPFAPNTGSVAKQNNSSARIDAAHALVR